MSMEEAWAEFDKAVKFEEKAKGMAGQEGKERLAATAMRASERALDKAVALERQAVEPMAA